MRTRFRFASIPSSTIPLTSGIEEALIPAAFSYFICITTRGTHASPLLCANSKVHIAGISSRSQVGNKVCLNQAIDLCYKSSEKVESGPLFEGPEQYIALCLPFRRYATNVACQFLSAWLNA